MSKKISIQLVQLNKKYGDQVYLPYSTGVLKSFVIQKKHIRDNFDFKEFIFLKENVSNMVNKIGQTDILGFSCYLWNWRTSLKLAEEMRKKNPNKTNDINKNLIKFIFFYFIMFNGFTPSKFKPLLNMILTA